MLRLLLIWLSLPSPDAPPQRLATSAAPSSAAATDATDAAGASAAATDAPTSPERPTSAAAAANAALTAALTAADAALAAAASTDAAAAAASLDATLTTAAAAASPQGLIGSPATSRLALEQLSAVNERLIALRDYATAQRPALPALTSAEEYAALAPAARLQRAEEVRGRVRVRVRVSPCRRSPWS